MTRGVRRGCGDQYQSATLSEWIHLSSNNASSHDHGALLFLFAGSLSCLLSKCRFLESNFLFLFPGDLMMESYQGCGITNSEYVGQWSH